MPDLPQHLDIPSVERPTPEPQAGGQTRDTQGRPTSPLALSEDPVLTWTQRLALTLQRRWTQAIQTVNAMIKTGTAAQKPTLPDLDEILFAESDTQDLYAAIDGAWVKVGTGVAGGDVTGPGTSTDNAVARWDGTSGDTLQDSGVTISDTDDLDVPGALTLGTVLAIAEGGTGAGTASGARTNLAVVSGRVGQAAMGAGNTSLTVTLSPAEASAGYRLMFAPDWNANGLWWANKATGSFDILAASPAPTGGGLIDWTLWRP